MRIIAIDQTDGILRVAYRWTNSVFEPPRLLLDLIGITNISLANLRQVLEHDYLGSAMQPTEYHVIALITTQTDLDAAKAAFIGLDVIGIWLDDPRLASWANWIETKGNPSDRVLALTYWGIDDFPIAELFDHFERGFKHWDHYAFSPGSFPKFLGDIRQWMRLTLIGRSAQALRDVYIQLTGEALQVPVIPDQLVIAERYYQGLPLTVIDSRVLTSISPEMSIKAPSLIVFAIASDPGVGEFEISLLDPDIPTIVSVVNTHHEPSDYAEMYAYLQAQLHNLVEIVELPQINAAVHAELSRIIGLWLVNWLDVLFPTADEDKYAKLPADLIKTLRRAYLLINTLH